MGDDHFSPPRLHIELPQSEEVDEWPRLPVRSRTFHSNTRHGENMPRQRRLPLQSVSSHHRRREGSRPDRSPPRRKPLHNNQPMIGTGQPAAMRALPKRGPVQQNHKKSPVGIFVTRLVPRTTAKCIEESIFFDTGMRLRAEQLQTKFPSYRSFFLRCDRRAQTRLMNPSIWPRDALVKIYFE